MKRICKRLTALVLALMLALGVFPVLADDYYTEVSGEDGVFTLSSVIRASLPDARFYAFVDGAWKEVGSVSAVDGQASVTDPGGSRNTRSYVNVSTLERFFGPFGFRADSIRAEKDITIFGYGSGSIWADTRWNLIGGEYVLPLSGTGWTSTYSIYYMPNQTQKLYGSTSFADIGSGNAFHTVTFTRVDGDGVPRETCVGYFPAGTRMSAVAAGDQLMPDSQQPVSDLDWFEDAACTEALDGNATLDGAVTLYTRSDMTDVTLQYMDESGTPVADAVLSFPVGSGTPVSDVLGRYDAMPGIGVPIRDCTWYTDAACTQVYTAQSTDTVAGSITLYTRLSRLTLSDNAGHQFTVSLPSGTNIMLWLHAHEDDAPYYLNGKPLRAYTDWAFSSLAEVTEESVVRGDATITARARTEYHITFLAEQDGAVLGSTTVYAGDHITRSQLRRFENMLNAPGGEAFTGWVVGETGNTVPFDEKTAIMADMTVWPVFAGQVQVNFWHSSSATTAEERFSQVADQLVGAPVDPQYVPDTAEVEVAAPKKGMRFAYWLDRNANMVYRAADKVWQPLDLYPVYERTKIIFKDADGNPLLTMYEGDELQYLAQPGEGQFYNGLRYDSGADSVLLKNGQPITREWLASQRVIGGTAASPADPNAPYAYEITVAPEYRPVRTIRFHEGADGEFHENIYPVMETRNTATLLGNLDIFSKGSTVGIALKGWTTEPNPAIGADSDTLDIFYPAYAELDADALDALFGDEVTADLYPVWVPVDGTIKLIFDSNYPDDAVDANGNSLQHREYVVYFPDDCLPNMPTLQQAGDWPVPSNQTDGQNRFVFAGWSLDQNGDVSDGAEGFDDANAGTLSFYGTYLEGAEYPDTSKLHKGGDDNTFYAIWIDRQATEAYPVKFFVRLDGTRPTEPGQYDSSAYTYDAEAMHGTLREAKNIVNDAERIEQNIMTQPGGAAIYAALEAQKDRVTDFNRISEETYGDRENGWWVEWYTCKHTSDGYHVDGRIRYSWLYELRYHLNGGSNAPLWTQHDHGERTEVNPPQNAGHRIQPRRDGYTFIGWNTEADGSGIPYEDGSFIIMDSDKDLYAQWQPNPITIPLHANFGGLKAEQESGEAPVAPTRRYTFVMRLVSFPEEMRGRDPGSSWTPVADADGTVLYYEQKVQNRLGNGAFSFSKLDVSAAGQYVFDVWEETGFEPVQYDASHYTLTVAVTESILGLGIQGYSLIKDGALIESAGGDVGAEDMFRFTNITDVRTITATKVWDDGNDQDGLRPASVTFHLLQNGQHTDRARTADASSGWTVEWENLEIYDPQNRMWVYTVEEDPVIGYDSTVDGNMYNGNYTITNTHMPETVEYTVTKVWAGDAPDVPHNPVLVTLTGLKPSGAVAHEETVQLSAENGWTHTFEELPRYSSKALINYTVAETPVEGYVSTQKKTQDGQGRVTTTITNTRGLTIRKELAGNAIDTAQAFTFTVTASDAEGVPVTRYPAPPASGSGVGYTVSGGTITFTLRGGEHVELLGLPTGGTMTVTETPAEGYITSWSAGAATNGGATCTVPIEAGMTLTALNTRNADIPTGVSMDQVPSLLLLGFALIGLAGRRYRRRRV